MIDYSLVSNSEEDNKEKPKEAEIYYQVFIKKLIENYLPLVIHLLFYFSDSWLKTHQFSLNIKVTPKPSRESHICEAKSLHSKKFYN